MMDVECPDCSVELVLTTDEAADLVEAMNGSAGSLECPECGYVESTEWRELDDE
jgi:hypothetical protein